jgi:hypothetical protein
MGNSREALWRWRFVAAVLSLGLPVVCASRSGLAQVAGVPAAIEVQLLSKLEAYDRNFAARAGDTARVLLVAKPGSAKSDLSTADMKAALARIERIGGLPHQETVVPFTGADALAQRCRDEHVAVVFLSAGFDDEVDAIRTSLSNANVLTLAADPTYVPRGIVLGFELESGKPRVVINLEQARRQGVDFSSDVLRLMTVYR